MDVVSGNFRDRTLCTAMGLAPAAGSLSSSSLSCPVRSMSNARRSSAEYRSGSHARHAPGTSTPFPVTSIKFEYPEFIAGAGGDKPCCMTSGSSPRRPAMYTSARERHEFANSLHRALTSLKPKPKPKPFTLNLSFKTPPSLAGRNRSNGSQRGPSPSFSSSDTLVGLSFYLSKSFS